MPENFHTFHSRGAATAEPVLGLPFSWGAVDFTGVIGEASIEDPETGEIGEVNALLIKARKVQFPGSVYPKLNQTFTDDPATKRYRVAASVHSQRNDPFITIPVVEIPL
jgi:hypothetical protein